MTVRVVEQLFRWSAMAAVPAFGLACATTGAKQPADRFQPTANPIIAEQSDRAELEKLRGLCALNTAAEKGDSNLTKKRVDVVTRRPVNEATAEKSHINPKDFSAVDCNVLCGPTYRTADAALSLASGEKVSTRADVLLVSCKPVFESMQMEVACLETWSWSVECLGLEQRGTPHLMPGRRR